MSHRSEEDADRTACLFAISQHLRISKQFLVVGGVDLGQLGCTILLEKGADLCGMTLAGLICENGSDLFQSQCRFGGSSRFCISRTTS